MRSANHSIPDSSARSLRDIASLFADKKIGVIGDVMLDVFTRGRIDRISPEAPVPVVRTESEQRIPGGAANVACGIVALSGTAELFGVRGKDAQGDALEAQLQELGVRSQLFVDPSRLTTVKQRIVAQGRHIIRVDWEDDHDLSEEAIVQEMKRIQERIGSWDALVIADYAKGYIPERFAREIIACAKEHDVPVIVDTKPEHIGYFSGVHLITPNLKEAVGMTGTDDVHRAGKILRERLSSSVLITRASEGMTLFFDESSHHVDTHASSVIDVSGAGDTVVVVAALAIATGASLIEAVDLASRAAGIVVGKEGTASVSLEELLIQL